MALFHLKKSLVSKQVLIIFIIAGLLSFTYFFVLSTANLPQDIFQLEPEPHTPTPTPIYDPCNGETSQCINNKVYSCINGILTYTGISCMSCSEEGARHCIADFIYICDHGEWTTKNPLELCDGCYTSGAVKCENGLLYDCFSNLWFPTGDFCSSCYEDMTWACMEGVVRFCNGVYWESGNRSCVECINGDTTCYDNGTKMTCINNYFQKMGSCEPCFGNVAPRCNNYNVIEICTGSFWHPTQTSCGSCTQDPVICIDGYYHVCIDGIYQLQSSQCCKSGETICQAGMYKVECNSNNVWETSHPLVKCITIEDMNIPMDVLDLNNDNQINSYELLYDLSHWGICPAATICKGDYDNDNSVDEEDLQIALSAWGSI